MSSQPRDWDAAVYDRVSGPQQAWADEQFERLQLRGDEVVLDAGCGSGTITARLVDLVQADDPDPARSGEAGCRAGRRSGGRVYGVDAAPSMAAHAAETLGARATILCQNLVELSLPEPVDVVFSNATFHWIADHDALFAAIHRTLKPGGRLVAQCGGHGNIAAFRAATGAVMGSAVFAGHFDSWRDPWNFATPADTIERLVRAGFSDPVCWLFDRPTSPEEPREFARTSILVRHLDVLPPELRDAFVDDVMAQFVADRGEPVVFDYVRLNITAVKPPHVR